MTTNKIKTYKLIEETLFLRYDTDPLSCFEIFYYFFLPKILGGCCEECISVHPILSLLQTTWIHIACGILRVKYSLKLFCEFKAFIIMTFGNRHTNLIMINNEQLLYRHGVLQMIKWSTQTIEGSVSLCDSHKMESILFKRACASS
jgi:hypothetical protein